MNWLTRGMSASVPRIAQTKPVRRYQPKRVSRPHAVVKFRFREDCSHLGSVWLSDIAASEGFLCFLELTSTSAKPSFQQLTINFGFVAICLAVWGVSGVYWKITDE